VIKHVFVLVEGQTEERFIKDVLAPEFYAFDTFFDPRLVVTKRVKHGASFKGGITTYGKFRNDLVRLLGEAKGRLVTTVVDYYGLPTDFPGMSSRPVSTARDRAVHIERAILDDLESPRNLLPFLALHEFEAWLFASRETLPRTLLQAEKTPAFAAIRDSFENPEEINEGTHTAPSKRIVSLFPGYRKEFHGPATAKRIGIGAIRAACPHFNSWYSALEQFATT
jgi:Domain of unknown function (DUF4276)